MKSAKPYIAQHKDRFIDELIALLKIPSISADKAYAKDVIATADVIKSSLEKAGCDHVEICETPGYPIVYGEKIIDPTLPTILVYAKTSLSSFTKSLLTISPESSSISKFCLTLIALPLSLRSNTIILASYFMFI